ncbi:MAG TPA: type III pantothenate kinase [Alphaproteobacteria bacterium]|nr:type III pantothenate kinase [Alphaproteobacteria bacterium]
MLLAVDQGNTNTVFAVFEGEALKAQWRIATDARRTAEEYVAWLSQLMGIEGLGFGDLHCAIVSTVVPQGLRALDELCRRYARAEPLIVSPALDLGIRIAVPRPEEVGADRLVNAVAAAARYDGALILVDFGTATTFDAIGQGGVYEGGVIAPGINLSLQALHDAAAMLPRVAVERPKRVIGTGTVSAMQSGVYWGYVGLIEGIVARMKDEMGRPVTVIATGGLAPLFARATSAIDHLDQDLTIFGLLEIHRRNRPNAA